MMVNYYRKPSPETMGKNRDEFKKLYSTEIKWLKNNLTFLKDDKFMMDMYTILITGSRKMTPKMIESVQRSMISPRYNKEKQIEAQKKLEPILEKISLVLKMAEHKGDKAVDFINNVKEYVETNYRITKKQMEGLNKVYKRVSEDLFKNKGETNDT